MSENDVGMTHLLRAVREGHLLDPSPLYYSIRIVLHLALFCVAAYAIALLRGHLWAQLLLTVVLSFLQGQMGIIVHDAGHRQMFASAWKNRAAGLLHGNIMMGMAFGFWVDKHDRHHRHPNQLGLDPDIDFKLHAYCDEQLRSRSGVLRFMVKYQAPLLPLLICFEGFNLKYDSIVFLLQGKAPQRGLEAALMVVHHVFYIWFAIWLGPVPGILFVLVNHVCLGFYFSLLFIPNHIGMPILERDSKLGYLYQQVSTARNLIPHPVTGYIYGTLMYQIEHHVFPRIPYNRLHEARAIVRPYCQSNGVPYAESGVLRCYLDILRFLHRSSAPLRNAAQ